MSGKRKGKLYDVAILRVFCILVVVFFHCYQMMWAEAHFPLTTTVYKDWYFKGVECGAISVAMPLFVFISGYLFYYLLMLGKYSTWRNLLQKKGLRILLPYVVFSLFIYDNNRLVESNVFTERQFLASMVSSDVILVFYFWLWIV